MARHLAALLALTTLALAGCSADDPPLPDPATLSAEQVAFHDDLETMPDFADKVEAYSMADMVCFEWKELGKSDLTVFSEHDDYFSALTDEQQKDVIEAIVGLCPDAAVDSGSGPI